MVEFNRKMRKVKAAIEDLAGMVEDNANVKEYFTEAYTEYVEYGRGCEFAVLKYIEESFIDDL